MVKLPLPIIRRTTFHGHPSFLCVPVDGLPILASGRWKRSIITQRPLAWLSLNITRFLNTDRPLCQVFHK
jgi:hypothetical protein